MWPNYRLYSHASLFGIKTRLSLLGTFAAHVACLCSTWTISALGHLSFTLRGGNGHGQCCQCRGLPAQLGHFEILCHGSKNCWAGGLKLGYFSFVCPRQLFFLQICQFPVNSESFWASSMSKNILFINFRDSDVLKSNQYRLSTSRGSQQSNCFSPQLGDFGFFTAEKHPNLGNWAYHYLIKIGLLWSHLPWVEKPIYRGLVL